MSAGGWNKGIKGTGGGMKGKKHSAEAIEKLKNRSKECYKKPMASAIITTELCDYGCNTTAKYIFRNGKKCCSTHQNSCYGKRKAFSDLDHRDRTSKSLQTRINKGITKTSQVKGSETRRAQGFYKKLAETMQEHWKRRPWQNNPHCPLIPYKNTSVLYQGSFEYAFLEELELKHGLPWVCENVSRGPSFWYIDPSTCSKRLYISDFLIHNTVYEIKSLWSWNKHNADKVLEEKNKAKLNAAKQEGFTVVLVLNKEYINA